MSKTILITGGAGFIGSHTADALLARGYRVRVLDALISQVHPQRCRPDYLANDVELLVGDICDPEAMAAALDGVDYVYHMAAETGVGQSLVEVERYVQTNVTGTAVLWQTIQRTQAPIKRLILASSRAVYGEGEYGCPTCGVVYPGQREAAQLHDEQWHPTCPHCQRLLCLRPVSETTPSRPVSVYGLTKHNQEELCQLMGKMLNIPVTILRYFNVYGPRQAHANPYTGVVIHFFRQAMARQPVPLYERGLPIRDFVHVLDVVQANLLALHALPTVGPAVYNVGSGQAISIRELAEMVFTAVNLPPRIQSTSRFRLGDIFGCYADLSRIQRLGYTPEVAFADGLATLLGGWQYEETAVADIDSEMRRWGVLQG
ncbi:MAG: NAD-dependent epimerase/dehydratase family protein [Anaerolineales bacterium]|nr:NAD-dependent epimerase/dehydratase family protein [Anaerolineales bacterium]